MHNAAFAESFAAPLPLTVHLHTSTVSCPTCGTLCGFQLSRDIGSHASSDFIVELTDGCACDFDTDALHAAVVEAIRVEPRDGD